MVEVASLFAVGALGMVAGTLAFAWGGYSAPAGKRRFYATLVAISGIAAVAYGLMAMGVGWLAVGDRTVFVPRYVDWLLTTPLLVLYLGMVAGSDRRQYTTVVALDAVVMGTGLVGATLPGVERYALFAAGSVAYLALLYYLLGPMTARARTRPAGAESLYVRLRNLTVVLWTVYPIIWVLGPPGLDLLTMTMDVALVVYLDVTAKVGFGLIALDASATIESELGESIAGDAEAAPTAD